MPKDVCVLDEDHWINTARNKKKINVTVTWQEEEKPILVLMLRIIHKVGIALLISLIPEEKERHINSTYAIVPGWKSGWHSLCDRWGTKVREKGKKAN